jgi:hypothetical protein
MVVNIVIPTLGNTEAERSSVKASLWYIGSPWKERERKKEYEQTCFPSAFLFYWALRD